MATRSLPIPSSLQRAESTRARANRPGLFTMWGSVAALGGTHRSFWETRLLVGVGPRTFIGRMVLPVSVLFRHLALVVRGTLRLVDVLVHPVLWDRALPAITHAERCRIRRANA